MPSFLRLALLGAALLLSAAGVRAQEGEKLELRIALAVADANFNTTPASVFRLAEELGYFDRHGLDVTYVTLDGTPQAAAALISGAVDLADISIDAAIRLRAENDVPLRGVVAASTGNAFLIAARSDITTLQDLAGRSFAIADVGSLDHALTLAVLRSYGVAEPAFVGIGPPDLRIQALAAGQVDATTVSFGVYSSVGDVEGIHILVAPDDFSARAPALSKFVVGLEDTLSGKREAIARFTAALIETSRAMEADPATWVARAAAARPELSRENLERTAALNAQRWCINGCMSEATLEQAVAFIYEGPDFAGVPVLDYAAFVDLSFTQAAIASLGAAAGEGLDARN